MRFTSPYISHEKCLSIPKRPQYKPLYRPQLGIFHLHSLQNYDITILIEVRPPDARADAPFFRKM